MACIPATAIFPGYDWKYTHKFADYNYAWQHEEIVLDPIFYHEVGSDNIFVKPQVYSYVQAYSTVSYVDNIFYRPVP